MIAYINHNFYYNTYKGDMPEDEFKKLATKASYEVRKNIFNRDITGYEEEVQMATCSVADILYEIKKIKKQKEKLISSKKEDKVITSEQVADYSRTFASASNMKELDEEISNLELRIQKELRTYLLTTGLLYRGV